MDEQIIQPKPLNLQNFRKFFLYATIGLFSASALIGIYLILFGADSTSGKIVATTAILGAFSLFTMNNIIRLESVQKSVRYSAIGALISNLIWVIPSILMLWGFFELFKPDCQYSYAYGSYNYTAYNTCMKPYHNLEEVIFKTINTACVTSAVLTLVSNFSNFKNYTKSIAILKTVTIITGGMLGSYEVGVIVFNDEVGGDFWRVLAVLGIVLVFGLIVTPILVKINKKKVETPAPAVQPIDEAALRAQIEQEVRAKIAAEQAASSGLPQSAKAQQDPSAPK